ncbi:hypothetical protein V6N12_046067 [Hibiscus sabdariffa]|uniref:Retrotransposon gag protein n=1 Tax=Hibiscus sabdariffa TaxID=183260 RepID=A0ABR2G4P2_9ROSI
MEMKMIDAASGGALFNMTLTQAKELISTMAANSQQFGTISEPNQRVHEVNTASIENKLDQLTNIVSSLVAGKSHSFKACGICTMTDHPTDSCPNLHEENVNAIGNFQDLPRDPTTPIAIHTTQVGAITLTLVMHPTKDQIRLTNLGHRNNTNHPTNHL